MDDIRDKLERVDLVVVSRNLNGVFLYQRGRGALYTELHGKDAALAWLNLGLFRTRDGASAISTNVDNFDDCATSVGEHALPLAFSVGGFKTDFFSVTGNSNPARVLAVPSTNKNRHRANAGKFGEAIRYQ